MRGRIYQRTGARDRRQAESERLRAARAAPQTAAEQRTSG